MNIHNPTPLLAGLSPAQFMQTHWQRKPLLIRAAFPNFTPPVAINALKKLAKQDDVESRYIWQDAGNWAIEHGPFTRIPNKKASTLLVQGVDLHNDACSSLLHAFRFIPDARVDDVMISIANTGGGVGPHFDSYDVFLLQGAGQRRWSISKQSDLSLVDDVPLKILKNFQATEEFILNPGDMLYLPPHYAHDGIALDDDCMTISIGFRSPSFKDLAIGMLEMATDDLHERTQNTIHYQDPDQVATTEPASIPQAMVVSTLKAVEQIKFDQDLACKFLGCWLSEPKPQVYFDPLDADCNFTSGVLRLDRRSRMLYLQHYCFINGELIGEHDLSIQARAFLRTLADNRQIVIQEHAIIQTDAVLQDLLCVWTGDGWIAHHPK